MKAKHVDKSKVYGGKLCVWMEVLQGLCAKAVPGNSGRSAMRLDSQTTSD